MNIKCIIIDDNEIAKKNLKTILNSYGFIEIAGEFSNGVEAIDYINYLKPDVVFLDTEIKNISGFDIIDKISATIKPLFVFVSSNNECASKAFDYFAFDFITKPFEKERLNKTIEKIQEYKRKEELIKVQSSLEDILSIVKGNENPECKKINIKSGNKIYFLEPDSIKYITASGYYIEIFTEDNKKFLLRESLASIHSRINSNKFIRVHRSTIINSDFIEEIISSNYGETDVKIKDTKATFKVSKGYKKDFQEYMGVK